MNSCTTTTDSNGTKTTTIVPLSPSNLTGTVNSTTEINLSWTDNSTNELGFKIERKTGSGTYSVIGTTNTNELTFNDSNLSPSTTYSFRVYAYNNTGNSLTYSNEITVTTNTLITLPILTTTIPSSITGNSAVSGGTITSDGGATITARGIIWNTSTNPTVANNKTVDGIGIGTFTSNLQNLTSATTVYLRAYATNSIGTSYGNEISFTTKNVNLGYGLIAYYPFNGNANDLSGNGNHGRVIGATLATDRNQNQNSCYNFNANHWTWGSGGDEIYIPFNNIFNSQNISVSVWFYRTTTALVNEQTAIIRRFEYGYSNPNGQVWGIDIARNSSSISNWVLKSAPNNSQVSIENIGKQSQLNTWYNVTMTFDGQTLKQYENGILMDSDSQAGFSLNTAGNSGISIGLSNQANGNWSPFGGKIDDIGIWNRALSQDEITALYSGQRP